MVEIGNLNNVTYRDMITAVKQKRNHFVSSEDRAIGKTTAINNLCLELQSMGYTVLIVSPSLDSGLKYYADERISLVMEDYKGKKELFKENVVIVVDEVKRCMMDDLIKYMGEIKVPVVGYVNFTVPSNYMSKSSVSEPVFKKEYESKWINE